MGGRTVGQSVGKVDQVNAAVVCLFVFLYIFLFVPFPARLLACFAPRSDA